MLDPRASYRLDPRRVSKSKVESFDDCRLRYKLEAIDGVQVHSDPERLAGTVGHEALLILSGLTKGRPSPELVRQAVLFASVQGLGNQEAREKAQAILFDTLDAIDFRETVAVERTLEVKLRGGFAINGVLDRVDYRPKDNWVRVIDYKFGRFVPHGELYNDAQAQFYLTLARNNLDALVPEADLKKTRVTFERWWVALKFSQGPIDWTPELEQSARARALTHARAVEAEVSFTPTVGAHCKRCDFIGSCWAVTAELERRAKQLAVLPMEAVTLSIDELVERTDWVRQSKLLFEARYAALSEQLKASMDTRATVRVGPTRIDWQTKRGWRDWDAADPKLVVRALQERFGRAPSLEELQTIGTNGDAVEAFLKKNLRPADREIAKDLIDHISPRKIRRGIKFSEDDEEEGDAA